MAILEDAVVVEVEASLRLFGGKRRLFERIRTESAELGVAIAAWALTSLAALAFARAGHEDGLSWPLEEGLAHLSMEVLSAVLPHHHTLARMVGRGAAPASGRLHRRRT